MEAAQVHDDSFYRLHGDLTSRQFRAAGFLLSGRFQGLFERYVRYDTESRLLGEGEAAIDRPVGDASFWARARWEGRAYPDSGKRDFHTDLLILGTTVPFRGGRLSFSGVREGIDYGRTGPFDRRANGFAGVFRRSFHRRLDGSIGFDFDWSRYGRPAIRIEPSGPLAVGHQRDRARAARLTARYLRGFLYETELVWESVRSNSFGYSVGRRSATVSVTGWLPASVLFQVRGRLESVDYHDTGLDRVFVFGTGEAQDRGEDNNVLALRARRALLRNLALEGRLSWYRNESLLLGSYYRKRAASIGLTWIPIGSSDF